MTASSRSAGRSPRPAEPDESLVADARAALTPVQAVDGKLLALLGGHPGPATRPAGRVGCVRRISQG
jgi:hypothetical protein